MDNKAPADIRPALLKERFNFVMRDREKKTVHVTCKTDEDASKLFHWLGEAPDPENFLKDMPLVENCADCFGRHEPGMHMEHLMECIRNLKEGLDVMMRTGDKSTDELDAEVKRLTGIANDREEERAGAEEKAEALFKKNVQYQQLLKNAELSAQQLLMELKGARKLDEHHTKMEEHRKKVEEEARSA